MPVAFKLDYENILSHLRSFTGYGRKKIISLLKLYVLNGLELVYL